MGFEFYEERDFKDTELGPLPVDWEVVNFSDVVDRGKKYSVGSIKKMDYKQCGKLPIIDQGKEFIAGYWDNEEDAYNGELPVIIFGDHTRIFKYVDFRFVCGADGVKIILPQKDKINPLFFFYYLSKLEIPNRGYNRHYTLLKEISVPLPPLEEQKAIAEVLRSVQLAIEKTEEVIRATKELKKSMMKHLFTYGYVPVDETDKVKLKETEIGLIPEHWEVVRLGEVAEIFDKKRVPLNEQQRKHRRGAYPYCGANGIIDYIDAYIFDGEYVLLAEDGGFYKRFESSAYIMRGRFWANNHVHILQAKQNSNNYFLLYYLIYEDISRYVAGTTRQKLTQENMKKIPIPLPPLEEQKAIAEVLRAIDEKLQKEEEYKKALQNLFKSLLYHLMSGKIRVRRKTN